MGWLDVRRWLLALYPRAWRRRYGDEFLALLKETPASPGLVADCLRGAADAHLRPQVEEVEEARPAPVMPAPTPPPAPSAIRAAVAARGGGERAWASVIDQIIAEAERQGDFTNLPGAGKPLVLDDNPYGGEWAMAFSVVKAAGETLPWIALGREIEADTARLATMLDAASADLSRRRVAALTTEERQDYAAAWARRRTEYLATAAELDVKLGQFNGQVPTWRLEKGRLPPRVAAERFDAACPSPGPDGGQP